MEIINNNPTPPKYNPNGSKSQSMKHWLGSGQSVYTGLTLVAAGVLWLLYNLNVIDACVFDVIFSWQMLLVVIGGYLLSMRNWVSGGIIAGIGLVFLATDMFHIYVSFSKVILPLILIAIGLAVLLDRRK